MEITSVFIADAFNRKLKARQEIGARYLRNECILVSNNLSTDSGSRI